MLYEGTTGIQALDLLGRKVLGSGGELLKGFTKIVHTFCKENADNPAVATYVETLNGLNKEWGELTMKIGTEAMNNPEEVGAASVDYLMYSGYVVLGYLWARAATVAQAKLDAGTTETAFYEAKLKTARFYFERILPRTVSLTQTMLSGADNLLDLDAEHFAF
jgi:hypothetical protein